MSQDNDNERSRGFTAPPVLSRLSARDAAQEIALKDLKAERDERQLKTEQLRKLRLETEANRG